MLKVTLLGTGGTQPLPDRALAAAAVTVGGRSVLLDCGEGTQVGLRRYGVSAYRLSAVLLTHYHGDHILGLPGLLQTLGSLNRTEPLTIYGPKGIEPVAQAVTALAGPQAYPVRWQVADESFHIDTLKITPFPLTHRVPCCGYVLALPRARVCKMCRPRPPRRPAGGRAEWPGRRTALRRRSPAAGCPARVLSWASPPFIKIIRQKRAECFNFFAFPRGADEGRLSCGNSFMGWPRKPAPHSPSVGASGTFPQKGEGIRLLYSSLICAIIRLIMGYCWKEVSRC